MDWIQPLDYSQLIRLAGSLWHRPMGQEKLIETGMRTMSREEEILNWIRSGLQRYSKELSGYKVILFGSRSSRCHREKSDFDIGIYGEQPMAQQTFYRIADFFDSLLTLYRIDLVDLNRASETMRASALGNAEALYG